MKKGVSCLLAAILAVSSVTSAGAGETYFSKIREFIFAENGYDAELDTNGNGRVDVLDMCREKSKVLYPEKWLDEEPSAEPSEKPSEEPENKKYSFLSLGTPEVSEAEGVLYVPVNLAKTYIDLTDISFVLLWEPENFDLNYLEHGDFAGQWGWSAGGGFAEIEFAADDNLMAGGTLLNAKFDINAELNGDYEFMIAGVSALAYRDGELTELSEDECPDESPLYSFEIKEGKPVSVPSVPPSENQDGPGNIALPDVPLVDSDEIYNAMIALKSQYPEGMRWTNDNYYDWNGGIYSRGYGCAGFAFMLSDAAFGRLPSRMIKDYSGYHIRVGDILRMNNDTHSVIVLSIESDGVIVAEGNYNSSVHWGRKVYSSELQKLTYIMTRYPD